MKCSKAQRFINDYIDGLLKNKEVKLLEHHIKTCPDCRELLIDIKSIVDNAEVLDSMEPSGELWPVIRRQVLTKDRSGRAGAAHLFGNFFLYSRGRAFALSTFFAVVILAPLVYYIFSGVPVSNDNPEKIALNHFRIAEKHYQSAIAALDRAVEANGLELSPELETVFKKNLEIIDDSIRVCKAAVEKHPENPEAGRLLLICYTKKIELLNKMRDIAIQTG